MRTLCKTRTASACLDAAGLAPKAVPHKTRSTNPALTRTLTSAAHGRPAERDVPLAGSCVSPSAHLGRSPLASTSSFTLEDHAAASARARGWLLSRSEAHREAPFFAPSYGGPPPSAADHSSTSGDPQGGGERRSASVSEHEYRLRLGRAVHLLRSTLPQFMSKGLVDYTNDAPPGSEDAASPLGLDSLLVDPLRAAQGLFYGQQDAHSAGAGAPRAPHGEPDMSVYHPKVQFVFRAPIVGRDEEEHEGVVRRDDASGPALSFGGRTLYLTSSQVLRTALSALFTHASVDVEKIHFVGGGARQALAQHHGSGREDEGGGGARTPAAGADELIVRLVFRGVIRVTRYAHEYTTVFRYTFDPASGQIIKHAVERIQPAPGRKLWAGLTLALKRASFGFGAWDGPTPAPHPAPRCSHESK